MTTYWSAPPPVAFLPSPDAGFRTSQDAGLDSLVDILAEVLRVQPKQIDPEQTFHSLGMDSMLAVEFVATVNSRWASRIEATALYDHPTPAALARQLAGGTQRPRTPAFAASARPSASPLTPSPVPSAATAPVLEALRVSLASILCCDPEDIDASAPFSLLGLDSILSAEFMADINRTYGLDERTVVLYDHPTLSAMAAHVAARSGRVAPRAPLTTAEIDMLLDAVRDNRLSVDEAAALFDARAL